MARLWIWTQTIPEGTPGETGGWTEAVLADPALNTYIRTKPVIASKIVEDFYVIDRDGSQQSGRGGDYLVVEGGFERIERKQDFESTHLAVAGLGIEQQATRLMIAGVIEQVLEGEATTPAPGPGDIAQWALEAADAVVAAIAAMQ